MTNQYMTQKIKNKLSHLNIYKKLKSLHLMKMMLKFNMNVDSLF